MAKIVSIETIPQHDPYLNQSHGETWTALWIDPQDRKAKISQEYKTGATPSPIWHGLEIQRPIINRPDEARASEYLAGQDAQALLARICDGHTIDWDGNNRVGNLSDDANAALEELVSNLEELPETDWTLWELDAWLDSVEVLPEMTGADLDALVADLKNTAAHEHVVVDGDMLDYLTRRRDDLRADDPQEMTTDEVAKLLGISRNGVQQAVSDGKLPARTVGKRTLLIRRWDALDYQAGKRKPGRQK